MANVHDEWVERSVRELMSASTVEECKARASRLLKEFELSICASENAKKTNRELLKAPMERVAWVKLFDREMKNASNEDDAIARGSRVFDAFESSIHTVANTGINQSTPMDNVHDVWVERSVRELMSASTAEECQARASRLLKEFELSISASANAKKTNHARTNELAQQLQQIQLSNSNQRQQSHAP